MQPANQTEAAELAKIAQTVAERSSRILGDFTQKQAETLSSAVRDEMGVARAFMDLWARLAADPMLVTNFSINLWLDQMRLWQATWMRLLGMQAPPVAEPAKGDWRFKDEEWSKSFVFDYIKQSYLIAARHMQQAVSKVQGLPPDSEKKVAFFTRQYVDALAPSNFLLTNPQVLRETMATGGQNLVRGLNNLLADLERGGGQLRISMTDESAFQLGRNVATSPGKVIFQTELMQLIQYLPITSQVYRRPLVIIPPWINKYYILDLREKNSFIRWAVEQGHTVFVLSWVNPDARLAQKGFDDYMLEGPLAAMDAVQRATGSEKVSLQAFCSGGIITTMLLAHLAATGGLDRVAALSLAVTVLDWSKAGTVGALMDEESVKAATEKSRRKGYLDGAQLAEVFAWLRPNDLVWNYWVNNYLQGKKPPKFDILFWNADTTRMTAKLHRDFVDVALRNKLARPGGVTVLGDELDLKQVTVDSYVVAGSADHICPWESCYRSSQLLGGKVRFVLSTNGHIAALVNPPSNPKSSYRVSDDNSADAADWAQTAPTEKGSWWPDFARWLGERSAGEKPAPAALGNERFRVLEDAPGSYVCDK
jgi:polyhydroxyalkanoate synthase